MVSTRNAPYWLLGLILVACVVLRGPARQPAAGAAPHAPAHHLAHTTPAGFFALLGAGFLTGMSHCVGMCGPLVGAFSMRRRAAQRDLATPLVLFQLGRLCTYGLLGAAVGGAGAALAAVLQAWQGVFAIGMGGLAMLSGAGLLGLIPLQHWLTAAIPAHWVQRRLSASLDARHPLAPLGLGLAHGFLPCGAVYTVALLAAMRADPLQGASLMFLFGLGTLPAMLGVGLSLGLLSPRLRHGLYRGAALLVVLVGMQLTLRGLALYGHVDHMVIGGVMLW